MAAHAGVRGRLRRLHLGVICNTPERLAQVCQRHSAAFHADSRPIDRHGTCLDGDCAPVTRRARFWIVFFEGLERPMVVRRHPMVRLGRVVLAVLAMGVIGAGGAARADVTGQSEVERLVRTHATERYNVAVPGYSIRAGGGMTAINAPLSTVRRTVTDYGHYADFMPRFQKSRIVGKSGQSTDVYLQVSILHGAANIWAVTRFGAPTPEGAGERIEGRLHGQGNVDQLLAIWHLLPVDENRTIAKLELLIVPKLPLPGSVVTPELEYASDQAVSATRDRAEAASRGKPPEPRQDTAAN